MFARACSACVWYTHTLDMTDMVCSANFPLQASGLEHRWNELSSDQQGAYAARAMSELNRPDPENGAAAAGSGSGDGSSNVVFPSVHQVPWPAGCALWVSCRCVLNAAATSGLAR